MQLLWAEDQGPLGSDRGLAYGDGLFETIRVNGDQPVLPDAHTDRLCASAARLGFVLNRFEVFAAIEKACQRYRGCTQGWVLKLIATRGSGGRGYRPPESQTPFLLFSQHALPPMPDPAGVAACCYPHSLVVDPLLAGMKTLNRLPQVLAAQSIEAGCYETLMSNRDGQFLEGSRTNLFARDGDRWLTPKASDLAVSGIARQVLSDHLRRNGEAVVETAVDPALLDSPEFGGLLLINSVIGAVPVRRIGDRQLPITERLATIRNFMLDCVGI